MIPVICQTTAAVTITTNTYAYRYPHSMTVLQIGVRIHYIWVNLSDVGTWQGAGLRGWVERVGRKGGLYFRGCMKCMD